MAELESRVSNLETKFELFMQEMRDRDKIRAEEMQDFKNEMRDRDNQRHAEIQALDGKIELIRQSVQSIQDSGRNQTIVTFLGIAAMVVAVLLK